MIETVMVTIEKESIKTDINASPMSMMKAIGILLEFAEKETDIPQAEITEAILLANNKFPRLENAEEL